MRCPIRGPPRGDLSPLVRRKDPRGGGARRDNAVDGTPVSVVIPERTEPSSVGRGPPGVRSRRAGTMDGAPVEPAAVVDPGSTEPSSVGQGPSDARREYDEDGGAQGPPGRGVRHAGTVDDMPVGMDPERTEPSSVGRGPPGRRDRRAGTMGGIPVEPEGRGLRMVAESWRSGVADLGAGLSTEAYRMQLTRGVFARPRGVMPVPRVKPPFSGSRARRAARRGAPSTPTGRDAMGTTLGQLGWGGQSSDSTSME